MLCGIAVGRLLRGRQTGFVSHIITVLIWALLYLLGVEVGANPKIISGLLNSVIVSGSCAVLTTYFSAMTAFAIHAYRFKGREAIFTFILAIMMIPTQVTALGFVQLMTSWGLMDNFIPLIVPSVAAPVVFFSFNALYAS